MKAYSYDNDGKYIGEYNCQLDQLESKLKCYDVYLLPANATFEAPPEYNVETQIPVWNDGWTVEDLPEEPEPIEPNEPTDEVVTYNNLADSIKDGVNSI